MTEEPRLPWTEEPPRLPLTETETFMRDEIREPILPNRQEANRAPDTGKTMTEENRLLTIMQTNGLDTKLRKGTEGNHQ